MCGICASVGSENKIFDVLEGLKKLEYRGYDSSGIAYLEDKRICAIKSVGEIKNLGKKISKDLYSKVVIGHTRWATHGGVSEENSHPHFSADMKFAMVHNGIVENFEEIKKNWLCDIKLNSQTDTEVFVNLVSKQKGCLLKKIHSAGKIVKGSFAVAILEKGENKIVVAKRHSPLMIAQNDEGCMASSDISAFWGKYKNYYILEDDEFAVLHKNKIEFFDKNLKKIGKNAIFLSDIDVNEEKTNEKYYMLKEIKEQPFILKKTYFNYFSGDFFSGLDIEKISKFDNFHFIACGTAYHSGLMGARFFQQFCNKKCNCSIASEFRYDNNILSKNCLYIFVSQSGETADTIACAKLVKEKGFSVMCVTNVPYCSLNKLADFVLPTFAGREIAVASTKAYSAQVFTLLILALRLGNKIDLHDVVKKFVLTFKITEIEKTLLEKIFKFKKIFFMGREQDYVTSLEASLKLKEIAYINCMGMPAGELKHGTLALIDQNTLVVTISTQKELKEKIENNIQEVKARGGRVLLVSNFQHSVEVDYKLDLPNYEQFLMPIVSIIPLQMLAFEFTLRFGYNPDKPRNLAKSVTVE